MRQPESQPSHKELADTAKAIRSATYVKSKDFHKLAISRKRPKCTTKEVANNTIP